MEWITLNGTDYLKWNAFLNGMHYLKWNVFVFVEEHAELADADPEVPVGELVRYIEAQGPKFPPL